MVPTWHLDGGSSRHSKDGRTDETHGTTDRRHPVYQGGRLRRKGCLSGTHRTRVETCGLLAPCLRTTHALRRAIVGHTRTGVLTMWHVYVNDTDKVTFGNPYDAIADASGKDVLIIQRGRTPIA